MAPIDLVIFDMDGVLCHYDFARRLACLAEKTGLDANLIDEKIFRSGFDDLADQGHFSAEEYLRKFGELLGVSLSRADWLWARRLPMTPNTEMLALVARLQQQPVPVAMLTNNGPLLREGLDEVFPQAADLFGTRAFFSCQFASTKEDPAIFRALLDTLAGRPESTLFIDDSKIYVAAARQAGLQVHHFVAMDGLMTALEAANILI
jgi:putative hydrolase of the HAD superfamily